MNQEIVKLKIKNAVNNLNPTAEVILFGSRARGFENSESDWDILVLIDKENVEFKDEQLIRHKIYAVELEIEQPISTLVISKKDWNSRYTVTSLYQNVRSEGIIL